MAAENSQKALLSLDGGGMRGAFTLGVLGELESMLAHEAGRGESFVLADFFDYIGGTSTGAIIATGLSLGWSVSRLQDLYRDLGRKSSSDASSPRCVSGRSIRERRSTISSSGRSGTEPSATKICAPC